jgi:DNA mismatch repair protein MutS
MRQYLSAKEQYPDALLFFRLGDFYEMFFEDAVVASKALELTLTSRNKGAMDEVPMCGVPFHAAHGYIARLVDQGFKVAICEQMADPTKVTGIVPRQVVRVVTPGVILEPESLAAKANNFLVAFRLLPGGEAGIAALDVSTGELRATTVDGAAALVGELARLEPAELLVPSDGDEVAATLARVLPACTAEVVDVATFDPVRARQAVEAALGDDARPALAELSLAAIGAAGAAVAYAARTQPGVPLSLRRLVPYTPSDHLIIDDTTRTHLELVRTLSGERKGSLLDLIDETVTPMGGRLLRSWLLLPLCRVDLINRRLDAVEILASNAGLREELRPLLGRVADLERLLARCAVRSATPRELGALRDSLEALPDLDAALAGAEQGTVLAARDVLGGPIDHCREVADELRRALVPDPPPHAREGGIFARGYDAGLDELVDLSRSGRDYLARLEARERERTGIGSLKVRFNRVFGYYLEVTRANLKLVPADYVRKQTLATSERFTTPELEEYETKVLTAEDRRRELEAELFERLVAHVLASAARLTEVAARIAALDVHAALAHTAHLRGYVRPVVDSGTTIDIRDGRHPVVEVLAAADGFVANDVTLAGDGERLLIITGPNMAGKSTVLRQVALITLLAQAGSFVPAREANVGLVDRIFTRVGASDNLARGQSTFMVEMREAAAILRSATDRSLVLLDEIGRGTSTFDGLSIAWSVAEYLHDAVRCKVLFATHYHELTELARTHAHVANYNVAAQRTGDDVVFLRKLLPGGSNRSYGIDVARLAGLPESVIARARQLLENLEAESLDPRGMARGEPERGPQMELFAAHPAPTPVEQLLGHLEIERLTPLEALNLLSQLKRMVDPTTP